MSPTGNGSIIILKDWREIVHIIEIKTVSIITRLHLFGIKTSFDVKEQEEFQLLQSELDDFYTEKTNGAFIR